MGRRSRSLLLSVLLAACSSPPSPPPQRVSAPVPSAAASAPQPPPPVQVVLATETSCGIANFREQVVLRINIERAKRQQCGLQHLPPAPPLKWDDRLFTAAARHSRDMAARDYFEHASPEGDRVGRRATATGYPWRMVGENIAAGDKTVAGAMNGWMRSPDHCANIMQPDYTDVAVACVADPKSNWGRYWTMVLGRRR